MPRTTPFRPWLPVLMALLPILALVPSPRRASAGPETLPGCRIVEAWPGVRFTKPLGVVAAPGVENALYVLEQPGTVKRIARYRGAGAVPAPTPYVDLSARIFPRMQGGLLGLAFHPAFATNGRLFVAYLAQTGDAQLPFEVILAELTGTPAAADPASVRVLLRIPKSLAIHNGGCVTFGPDGKLYLSTGDNGKQKEAVLTSQNPGSLLGKILRIDVDAPSAGLPYGIPADNPWAAAGAGVRREIWAYGFRNPWRFSFDAQGTLWTAEPGTKGECVEWVVKVQRGGNHGWPFYEGTRPMEPVPPNLQGTAFLPPYFEYAREGGEGTTAAIGGFVYRGVRVPALRNQYVFADYGRGAIWSLQVSGARGTGHRKVGDVPSVSSIGEDAQGELYFTAHELGAVYTIAAGS